MSDNVDDQDMNFTEGEAEAAQPAKAKGAGPGLARILMIVGIGLGAVIFIVTVVVITVGIINRQGKPAASIPVGETYQQATEIYKYNGSIGDIRARTRDREPSSVAVTLNLGVLPSDENEFAKEVNERLPQIRDFLRNYFSLKYAEDLAPEREKEVKEELRENLNRIISKPVIKEILFQRFDVIKL
jgi:flagellar FliL protein